MKNMNLTFEDKDFKNLESAKELMLIMRGVKHSWEKFFIEVAKVYCEDNEK